MHMATAEWLIRGMLSLCDEGRELDRSEMLILKQRGKYRQRRAVEMEQHKGKLDFSTNSFCV